MAHFFRDRTISWKLLVNSLIFLLPTLVLFLFFLTGVNDSIRFNSLELLGNRFLAPLIQAQASLSEFSTSAEARDRVDQAVDEVTTLSGQWGTDLRLGTLPGELAAGWTRAQAQGRVDDLFPLVSSLITTVGNTSNLILDPDLDSYYLMDVTLLALPQGLDRLRAVREFALGLEVEPSVRERVRAAVLATHVREGILDRVVSSSRTAVAEDPRFYGANDRLQKSLPTGLAEFERVWGSLATKLEALANPQGALVFPSELVAATDAARTTAVRYWTEVRMAQDELMALRVATYERTRFWGITLTLVSILVAGAVALAISWGVHRSMVKTLGYSGALAEGDLVTPIDDEGGGEMGTINRSLEVFRASLHAIMRNEIRSTIQGLSGAIVHLTSSSQEISTSSNQQAAAVKEIVSTMEDSARLSRGIAEKIQQVTTLSEDTAAKVDHGETFVASTLETMGAIKATNDQTIAGIRTLGAKVESINSIVGIINAIASQTKIIAFNAELEASSAGEAGRNFEIVATEIRRLADKSGASTGEIRELIAEIQRAFQDLTEDSRAGAHQVSQGMALASELQTVFDDILSSANLSSGSAAQIAALIQQQVSAFEQILLTLRQISEGTDNFVASTRSTRQSAEELQRLSRELEAILGKFRLDS